MRCVVLVCVVLALGSGFLPAQDISKHLDPPQPPRIDEFVYIYELTLLNDEDDWFNGETEIMIRTKITKPGHETQVWAMLIDDIDMDGDVENEFTVLDAEETREERKGGMANIFIHFECFPVVPMNLDIEVWEVDSSGVDDFLEAIAEAAGLVTDLGLIKGKAWIGKAADLLAETVKKLSEGEDSMGTESTLVVEGISDPSSPTVRYRYRTLYLPYPSNDSRCIGTMQEVAWELQGDPTLDAETRDYYDLLAMGWDEDHPFTTCPDEATRRLALLQEALELADELSYEIENHPGMEHHSDGMKGGTVAIACDALEKEVSTALAAEVIPPFVYEANQELDDGRALARTGDYATALTTCFNHLPELLRLNHPLVYNDGFENTDTRMWTATYPPVIVVD